MGQARFAVSDEYKHMPLFLPPEVHIAHTQYDFMRRQTDIYIYGDGVPYGGDWYDPLHPRIDCVLRMTPAGPCFDRWEVT
jgi:hypothetical protein